MKLSYLGWLSVSIVVFNCKELMKEILASGSSFVLRVSQNVKFRQLVLIVVTPWLQQR